MLHKILQYFTYANTHGKQSRQYRLIHYISWELVAVCIAFTVLYAVSKQWVLLAILVATISMSLLNLLLLHHTQRTFLCGHILTLILFLALVSTNCLIWGIGPIHSQWFYVMPLLAASLTGMGGLFAYAIASMIALILCGQFTIPPYYQLPAYLFLTIEWLSHVFAYLVIVTTLASLIHENQRYEKELNDKNDLLRTEKDKYLYLAQFDHLTNLPNRRYFIQHLHQLIDSLDQGCRVTVFFIDLDNFKLVNDCYGHNIGDQVLLETSRRLKLCFRDSDFIARLGGDEFTAIVLHTANRQITQTIAERVIHEFEPKFKLDGDKEYHYSVSIGYATYPDEAQTASELIVKADLAMYTAKKITGNSYSPKQYLHSC